MKHFRKFSLRHIIIVDIELTCWKGQNDDRFREIIEIGVVKVDNVKNIIVDKEQYFIKNVKSEISDFCTELTGISQELLNEKGITFEKLIKHRFGSLNKTWCGWGCGDYNAMEKNAIEKKCPNAFSDNYINLSEIYGLIHGLERSKSLKKAMNDYDVKFKGRQHSGIVDAVATAELYLKFLKKAQ
jgi:inhibitor of KinA sporulation pathway (predicted exonuclease)